MSERRRACLASNGAGPEASAMSRNKKEETRVSSWPAKFLNLAKAPSYPGKTFGDTKKSNSLSESWTLLVLKRWPKMGMLPSKGT